MLILTRRVGETIRIDDNFDVTVVAVKSAQVRLGVQAPKDVPVHREEVFKRLRRCLTSEISVPDCAICCK